MKVSFITTVYNEGATIGLFLDSLARQSRKPDEVVIVDGGSTDDTVAEIERREKLFTSLRVIEQRCNIAEGRNIAIRAASGDVITMSDAGCRLADDWCEEIVRPFESDPEIEVVAGNWRIERESGIQDLFRWYYLRNRGDFSEGPSTPANPSARSFAIRRHTWIELGGHPEFLYAGEDTLFNLKWEMKGKRSNFAQQAVCYWRMHVSLRSFGRQVFNYSRAAGRLARASTFRRLIRSSYELGAYLFAAILILMGIVSIFPFNMGLYSASACILIVALARRRLDVYRSARNYGLSVPKSIAAVGISVYCDFLRARGILAGYHDRGTGNFELNTLQYMVDGSSSEDNENVRCGAKFECENPSDTSISV